MRRRVLTLVVVLAVAGATTGCDMSRFGGPADTTGRTVAAVASLGPAGLRMSQGVELRYGCPPAPDGRCHWGGYAQPPYAGITSPTLWISPKAFTSTERLRYVVAHELAHNWYQRLITPAQRATLTSQVSPQQEVVADCTAQALGSAISVYGRCNDAQRRLVLALLAQ